MKYYFCLVPDADAQDPVSLGKTYVYNHRSEWLEGPADIASYLTAGYVKGVDHVVHNNIAYMLLKSYIDLDSNFVVILCRHSVAGCDN